MSWRNRVCYLAFKNLKSSVVGVCLFLNRVFYHSTERTLALFLFTAAKILKYLLRVLFFNKKNDYILYVLQNKNKGTAIFSFTPHVLLAGNEE